MPPIMTRRLLEEGLMIVEDDPIASDRMQRYFSHFFKNIWVVGDVHKAWEVYDEHHPRVIISDIELPHFNGLSFIEKIRLQDTLTLIFIASAFPKEEYLLAAISLNLESFVVKPLTSIKLESIITRCYEKLAQKEACLDASKGLHYCFARKILFDSTTQIALTYLEIVILEKLIEHKNKILTYAQLEDILSLENSFSRNSLRVIITRLRQKHSSICIENHPNQGYCLKC